MQKIVYIQGSYLYETNELLKDGWEVVSLHPISTHTTNTSDMGAYVVLQPVISKCPHAEYSYKEEDTNDWNPAEGMPPNKNDVYSRGALGR